MTVPIYLPSERKMKPIKNRIRRKEEEKVERTREINNAKLKELSLVLNVPPSSRMSSSVLEHVYDCVCRGVALWAS